MKHCSSAINIQFQTALYSLFGLVPISNHKGIPYNLKRIIISEISNNSRFMHDNITATIAESMRDIYGTRTPQR